MRLWVLLLALFTSAISLASPKIEPIPLTAACISDAAAMFGYHEDILYALLIVEGGTVGRPNRGNSNGTADWNVFQINSTHFPYYAKLGISRETLIYDGCSNAYIAADILRRQTANAKPPTTPQEYLKFLARYHSKNEPHNTVYAGKLLNAFNTMNAYRSKHAAAHQ